MRLLTTFLSTTSTFLTLSGAQLPPTRVVLTNDDGWAEANIRAQFNMLLVADYEVVLSAPADNQSGTGPLDLPATERTSPCEFNSCPANSPPQGFNSSDPRLNYVNSFPVTAVKYGIQELAPQFFSGNPPDIVISGPNVGGNTGLQVFFSGTVNAASEAAKEGIPALAFSGATGDQRSYTDLVDGDYSFIYAQLATKITNTLIASGTPFLPPSTALNINFPTIGDGCSAPEDFKFVLTRIFPKLFFEQDVLTCGTTTLPTEASVVGSVGKCLSSISVFNPNTKLDSNAATQGVVLQKLSSILSCS